MRTAGTGPRLFEHGSDGTLGRTARTEKRLSLPLIGATSFFFLVGVGFAMFALPLLMRVLTSFAPPDLHYLPDGNELLGFIFLITIAFGLVFELPVILWTLGMLRIISSWWL